jgi:hypothetical protein
VNFEYSFKNSLRIATQSRHHYNFATLYIKWRFQRAEQDFSGSVPQEHY